MQTLPGIGMSERGKMMEGSEDPLNAAGINGNKKLEQTNFMDDVIRDPGGG